MNGMYKRWPETCALHIIILMQLTMDKQRQEQNSTDRDRPASGSRLYDESTSSGENTSGLREKSVEEDTIPGERDLDLNERIEQVKEDADLDRVK